MIAFYVVAALLVVAVLLSLLRPLLRAGAGDASDDTRASNVRILREQLAELDAERAAGTLTAEHHAAARAELERRVLEDTRAAEAPARSGGQGHN